MSMNNSCKGQVVDLCPGIISAKVRWYIYVQELHLQRPGGRLMSMNNGCKGQVVD